MHIILATDIDFARTIKRITSWNFALIPWDLRDCNELVLHDFYLGSSKNQYEWALAPTRSDRNDDDDLATETLRSACTAILVDPPNLQEHVFIQILYLVSLEIRKSGHICADTINQIISAIPFKQFARAESYLPELPKDWLHLPAELCVGFEMAEGACIGPQTFEEFSRDTFKDALEVLCGPRHDGLLIGYSLVVQEVIPMLSWDVDWPLSRRGKKPPHKRTKVQGVLPWQYEPDPSILSVYQYLPPTIRWMAPPYYGEPVIRLRVGGRSQQEAIANWHQCARALRKLQPQWEKKGKTP